MANIGRRYRRLFRRDLGYRASFGFTYLPDRIRFESANTQIFPGVFFRPGFHNSEPGEVNDSTGTVTYFIQCVPPTSTRLSIRWERKLSPQKRWNTDRATIILDGVDRFYTEDDLQPFASFDFGASSFIHVIQNPPPNQDFLVMHATALIWALE